MNKIKFLSDLALVQTVNSKGHKSSASSTHFYNQGALNAKMSSKSIGDYFYE